MQDNLFPAIIYSVDYSFTSLDSRQVLMPYENYRQTLSICGPTRGGTRPASPLPSPRLRSSGAYLGPGSWGSQHRRPAAWLPWRPRSLIGTESKGQILAHIVMYRRRRNVLCTAVLLSDKHADDNGEADDADDDGLDGAVVGSVLSTGYETQVLAQGLLDDVEQMHAPDEDTQMFAGGRLDLSRGARSSVTELVGETSKDGAESGRGDLAQVNGDDTPCTLDSDLDKEGTGSESAKGVGQDP